MCRVLKPGGHGLIIMGLGAVNKILTELTFRTMLLKKRCQLPGY
jgi:hypothetical protein